MIGGVVKRHSNDISGLDQIPQFLRWPWAVEHCFRGKNTLTLFTYCAVQNNSFARAVQNERPCTKPRLESKAFRNNTLFFRLSTLKNFFRCHMMIWVCKPRKIRSLIYVPVESWKTLIQSIFCIFKTLNASNAGALIYFSSPYFNRRWLCENTYFYR